MNIYVDGIKVREYSGWVNNNNYPLKENIYIGSFAGGSDFFHSAIDDVRIYDEYLSSELIKEIYEVESEGGINRNFDNLMTIPSGSLDTEAFVYAVDDDIFEAVESFL